MDGFAIQRRRRQSGVVLVETLVSSLAAVAVISGLLSAAVAIRRSIGSTDRYSVGLANETRLTDYVAQDLRRALRVSMLNGSTSTPIKTNGPFVVTESNILTINIPDYYGSNSPNNAAGSTFKVSRYPRTTLNTASTYNGNAVALLNGVVPWSEAVTTVASKSVTRFAAPAVGTGEIQVRYYRGPRSNQDATVCYFRSENSTATGNAVLSTREIAERISDNLSSTTLAVTGRNNGQIFRLQTTFTSRYRYGNGNTTGTDAFVDVSTRNVRRD